MTHYLVTSPEMSDCFTAASQEPPEHCAICVSVDAPNARAAKVAAVKHHEMQPWVIEARGDHVNPFAGLKAMRAECPHGVCLCDLCQADNPDDAWCDECEAELDMIEDAKVAS